MTIFLLVIGALAFWAIGFICGFYSIRKYVLEYMKHIEEHPKDDCGCRNCKDRRGE
jgi:hypothetical protein